MKRALRDEMHHDGHNRTQKALPVTDPHIPREPSQDGLEGRSQEEAQLKAAVDHIAVLEPDILLVERSVGRLAQELLLERGIALVLNVKGGVLDRLGRCTGAKVPLTCIHMLPAKVPPAPRTRRGTDPCRRCLSSSTCA